MKNIIKCILFSLCVLCLSMCSSYAHAQEVGVITKEELELCLTIVNNLEVSNKNKTQLLEKQKTQIEKLETQLENSQKLNNQMELELQNLNASFKEYSNECKKKLRKVKTQRTVAYTVAAGILYAYVKKC